MIFLEQRHNLTIDDISRELGVSKTTVSRAISGKGRISEATRARIREYIALHNYRPSAAAKALAESKTYNLALVLPKSFIHLELPYIRRSLSVICEEAFLQDYNILICLSTDDTPDHLLRTLDNRKVDGVILSRTVENDALVDILLDRGIPFATMGSLPQSLRGKAVVEADHDQIGGCHAFSREFLRKGTEKVALLGNDLAYIVNQSRLPGFRSAVQELEMDYSQIPLITGLNNQQSRAAAVQQLYEQGVRRFLCMDDDICVHVLAHLQSMGIRIPEDVQIASLIDDERLAQTNPPVSALEFDPTELGRAACRELLHYLKNEAYDPCPLLGYRIIHRNSV